MKPADTLAVTTPTSRGTGHVARKETTARIHAETQRASFHHTFAQIQPTITAASTQVRVQHGDTLIGLTRKYLSHQGISTTSAELYVRAMALAKQNRLENPDLIRVGQTLNFSNARPSVPPAQISEQPATAQPQLGRSTQSQQLADHIATDYNKVAVVGDSIAVGIGGALLERDGITPQFAAGRKFLSQTKGNYVIDATGGHSSPQILDQLHRNPNIKNAELAIISVGTNDFVNSKVNGYYTPERITRNLESIRSELKAKKSIWVLPYDLKAKELVESVARHHGDQTIDLAQFRAADRYHPQNYNAIASNLSSLLTVQNSTAIKAENLKDGLDQQSGWASTQNVLLARGARL